MLQSEFYLGLPNEIWNSLISEAEDLLKEEEIGVHMLGVYPSGSRIFGIESESPQFTCIYMDAPEYLLNPLHKRGPNDGFTTRTMKLDCSTVVFIELYSWIQWLIYKDIYTRTENYIGMHDIIPCYHDIVYQDQSLDGLLEMARKYIDVSMHIATRNPIYNSYNQRLRYALYLRTFYVFLTTKKFYSNMNHDFGYVHQISNSEHISDNTYDTDLALQKHIREDMQYGNAGLASYSRDLRNSIMEILCSKDNGNSKGKIAEEMGKEVVKIYKFII